MNHTVANFGNIPNVSYQINEKNGEYSFAHFEMIKILKLFILIN